MSDQMVKEYKNSKEFQKDLKKQQEKGWSVFQQTETRERRNFFKTILGGFIFHRPKNKLLVTYQRES